MAYWRQQLSFVQQFGASVFHTVVCWHKLLGEVEYECPLCSFIVLVNVVPKVIKVGENLTKLCQKQFWLFFIETWCSISNISGSSSRGV